MWYWKNYRSNGAFWDLQAPPSPSHSGISAGEAQIRNKFAATRDKDQRSGLPAVAHRSQAFGEDGAKAGVETVRDAALGIENCDFAVLTNGPYTTNATELDSVVAVR